jgi:hypothetical protein
MMSKLQKIKDDRKHAEAALKVFATLRGSEGDFRLQEEAAELIRVLAGPRIVPTSDELTA